MSEQKVEDCSEGLNDCNFTFHLKIEIKDKDGKVINQTGDDLFWPMTFPDAIMLKYAHLERMVAGGKAAVLKAAGQGSLLESLKD